MEPPRRPARRSSDRRGSDRVVRVHRRSVRTAAGQARFRAGRLRVARTTVEYAENLLGTDSSGPRLSWELAAGGQGARQSAYQVRVAADADELSRRPLWDSGRVTSDRTVGVPYAGPTLHDRTRYHWQVRVWDEKGRASAWSEARWWETALPSDGWRARWIGADAPPAPPGFDDTSWIWAPGPPLWSTPVGPRWFRATLGLPAGTEVTRARVSVTADDDFTLCIDGRQVLHQPERTDSWREAHTSDVTELVRAAGGQVAVAVVATNRGDAPSPAGLLLRLEVESSTGRHELVSGPGGAPPTRRRTGGSGPITTTAPGPRPR
ncbi:hypothetical protein NKH18_09435 [Streptomyces sp. M10(2022)]